LIKTQASQPNAKVSESVDGTGFLWTEGIIMIIVSASIILAMIVGCMVLLIMKMIQRRQIREVKRTNTALEMKCDSYRRQIDRRSQSLEMAFLRSTHEPSERTTYPGPQRKKDDPIPYAGRDDPVPYAVSSIHDHPTNDPRFRGPLTTFRPTVIQQSGATGPLATGSSAAFRPIKPNDADDGAVGPDAIQSDQEKKSGLTVREKSKIMKHYWFYRNPNPKDPPALPPRN